ncbi:TonB family protein [Pontibacter sp. BT731]|uniref:energy transducer TonB n=1 Tax=Pontibacter coccineus TaxID=3063328 RepID=UPI0026E414B7|nr:energy transducer TonB [Pontibacter sp. BT731]MDO6389436.1 TonB family protein [Pontibacter sp. BT731]
MKHLYLSFFAILLAYSGAFGQVNATLYFNELNQLTTEDKAAIKREVAMDMSQLQFNGPFKDYDSKGNLVAEGTYVNGSKGGLFKTYRNGQLESEIEFNDNEFVIREWIDATGQRQVTNGAGTFTMPYTYLDRGVVGQTWKTGLMHGQMKDGKRDGKWVFDSEQKIVLYEEDYKAGAFLKRKGFIHSQNRSYEMSYRFDARPAFDYIAIENLELDTTSIKQLQQFFEHYPIKGIEQVQRDIAYPGGMAAFMQDVGSNIRYPAQDQRAKIQGQVIVSFAIDEKGQLKDLKVLKSLSPTLDAEAVRVIELVAPKLVPALLDGKPYESILSIPVSFRIG